MIFFFKQNRKIKHDYGFFLCCSSKENKIIYWGNFKPKMVIITITFLFFWVNLPLAAQNRNTLANKLDVHFSKLSKIELPIPSNTLFLHHIFSNNNYNTTKLKIDLLKAESLLIGSNKGLELIASGRYTFEEGNESIELNDINSRMFLQAGLRWNILKNGLVENQHKKKQITLKKSLLTLENLQLEHNKNYNNRYQTIVQSFYQQLYSFYQSHQSRMESELELYYDLYYKNYIPFKKIIELKKNLANIRNIVLERGSYVPPKKVADSIFPQLYQVQLSKILEHAQQIPQNSSQVAILKDHLELEFKSGRLPRLSFYGNIQWAQRFGQNARFSPNVGFQFSLPLKAKMNHKVKNHKEKIIESEQSYLWENRKEELRIHYLDYQEQLNQLQDLYFNFRIAQEDLKTVRFTKQFAKPETYIASLTKTQELFEIKETIIKTTAQLHIILLKIFTKSGISFEQFHTSLTPINPIKIERKIGLAAIWDTSKKNKNSTFLIQYLKRKNYTSIYLKGNQNKSQYSEIKLMLEKEHFKLLSDTTSYKTLMPSTARQLHLMETNRLYTNEPIILNDLHRIVQMAKSTL